MLEYLRIRGLALIDDMELEFGDGMNVLTGETGAGKSFILKAINFVLGDRLATDMVRPGRDKAQVEALFTRQGPEGEEEIVLRRELSAASGRSHFFLNGSLTSQDAVRALRPALLFHVSQHGQQRLLQPSYQAALIDAFLPDPSIVSRKDALVRELKDVGEQRRKLLERMDMLSEKRELLEMQQKEIEKVAPEEGEEERLEQARAELKNVEHLRAQYEQGLELMLGGEGAGLAALLGELEKILHSLIQDDESFSPSLDALLNFEEEARELTRRFRSTPSSDCEYDPDELEARLYELSQLKRRMRRSIPEILRLRDEITENLSFLDACGLDLHRLEKQERELAKKLHATLEECNELRREAAARFCTALERELSGLGFSEQVARGAGKHASRAVAAGGGQGQGHLPRLHGRPLPSALGPEPRTAPAAAGQNCLGRRTFPLPSGRGGRAIHKRRRHPYFRRSGRRRGRHDAEPRVRQAA